MKTYLIYIAIMVISLMSCKSEKWASADSYPDDIYFNPTDKPLSLSDEYIPTLSDKQVKKENRKEQNKKESQYLKENPNYSMEQVTADMSDVQNTYSDILTNDSISEADTVLYYNDDTGYWVDGFKGSAMDLDYATRIIKFHGPFVGVPYWSPLYSDVLTFNTWDWNVYVDNNYVYAFPSYSSPAYWNTGFYAGFGMGFGFGYGYGYGWGYPYYNPWYYPWYGYYPPYYNPWYGWPYPPYYGPYPPYYGPYPPYCGPVYGPGYPSDENYYYGPRKETPTSGRVSADNPQLITSPRTAEDASSLKTPSTTTRKTMTPDNNLEIKRGNTSYTRISRSNQPHPEGTNKSVSGSSNTGSSNGTVNIRTTRRSYSSYSRSTSAKKSTFNRPTYTRSTSTRSSSGSKANKTYSVPRGSGSIYTAPRRSSSAEVSSTRSGSSRSKSYSTGSSRSSSSSSGYSGSSGRSYVPSSTRSTGTSSYSTSGSSYHSTRSSSGSSRGSSTGSRGRR